jgi:predicted dinucleotide-binding enzyme
MKKVGIIGSGVVGIALAKGFVKYGYATTIASRNVDKRKELEQQVEGIATNSLAILQKMQIL